MNLEIRIAEEDLENGLKDMEATIEELNKPNVDKSKEEMYVNLATKQDDNVKYLIRALILQIRLLNNEEEKKKYNESKQKLSEKYNKLRTKLMEEQKKYKRFQLLGDKDDEKKEGDATAGDVAIQQMNHMQNKMKANLGVALSSIEESKEIGQTSLEVLFEQTEQMDNINNELNSLGAELDQSTKLLKKIGSNMMTDRIFLVLVTVFILILLGSAIVGAFTETSDKDTTPPASP